MRDILNKPLLELFKKDSTVDVEVQHDAIASLPPNFLNRPISELFQKASDVRSVDPDKHDVTSSENHSSEHSATAHRNIFLRPISELFKHTDEDLQEEDDDQVSVLEQLEAIISRLDAEYETLLIAFTNVQHFIAKQNIAAIVEHLSEFRTQFKAYLVLESGLLHHLLKDTETHSEPEAKIWSDYRVEMHRFTNTILRFLRKWTEHKQVSQPIIQRFEEDYVNTYDVLADRMQHEHSIFNILPLLSKVES